MKRPLKKLSPSKQRELDRYVEIVEESFAKATATKRADRLKDGRILKIILYGSYARGDWVHDPVGRYFSDFDLLVIVDHEDLTDPEYWAEANDRLMEQVSLGASRTPTELIVHSLDDVNWKLEHGRPFFIETPPESRFPSLARYRQGPLWKRRWNTSQSGKKLLTASKWRPSSWLLKASTSSQRSTSIKPLRCFTRGFC